MTAPRIKVTELTPLSDCEALFCLSTIRGGRRSAGGNRTPEFRSRYSVSRTETTGHPAERRMVGLRSRGAPCRPGSAFGRRGPEPSDRVRLPPRRSRPWVPDLPDRFDVDQVLDRPRRGRCGDLFGVVLRVRDDFALISKRQVVYRKNMLSDSSVSPTVGRGSTQ
jgi:hypothetical protein